jgi:hypothetical protein
LLALRLLRWCAPGSPAPEVGGKRPYPQAHLTTQSPSSATSSSSAARAPAAEAIQDAAGSVGSIESCVLLPPLALHPRPYRIAFNFRHVLDMDGRGGIPVGFAAALQALRSRHPRVEFQVLSFCINPDTRANVRASVQLFQCQVGGPLIFTEVNLTDIRTGCLRRLPRGGYNTGGKDH